MSRVVKGTTRTFKPTTVTKQQQQQQQPTHPECTPAEKMKQKAMAAKAARAAEKLRNPSAFRRSTSIITDVSSTSTSHINNNHQRPAPEQQDISVPSIPTTTVTNQPWSPPIDPLLDMAAFVDQHTHDIPVPNIPSSSSSLPPTTTTLSTQTLSAPTNTQTQPTHNPKPSTATASRSKPPAKKNNAIREQSNHEEEEEDISPRLKRKRHLEQLRRNKKNKMNVDRNTPQAADDGIEKTNKRLAARFKRRLEHNGTSQRKAKKAKRGTKKDNGVDVADEAGNGAQATGEEGDQQEGTDSDDDDDEPLDPTKVSMASLTNPYRCKGKASEVLEKRRQLIIERREREKQERAAARAENTRQAKLVLINRAKAVKARRKQLMIADQAQGQDVVTGEDDEALEQVPNEEEQQPSDPGQQQQENENEAQARKQKIMQEYGLEDVDSDDDLEDFEEVEYEEFAKNNKKKNSASAGATTTSQKNPAPSQNDEQEEEEEEVIEEDFNVDDYVPQASQYAPQLRLVNGQMVLDQDSLEVDRRDHSPQLDDLEVVEESDATRLVNSNTWSKAVRGERWTAEETCLFYDAVRLFGSDFEMISQLFPGRTRRQIRLKWRKEEKRSPEEITQALLGKKKTTTTTRGTGDEEESLERISERSEHGTSSGEEEAEGSGAAAEEGEEEGEVEMEMPGQLHGGFRQYARLVGIDLDGPIPADPMDKWREKERLQLDLQAADKASPSLSNPDDDDTLSLVDDAFVGWGEQDE